MALAMAMAMAMAMALDDSGFAWIWGPQYAVNLSKSDEWGMKAECGGHGLSGACKPEISTGNHQLNINFEGNYYDYFYKTHGQC